MALATYSDLVSAVGDWLNRDDLTSRVPDFIALFEARVNRLLRVPAMEAQLTQSTSEEIIALPSDCLSVREVAIDGDPDTVLSAMSPVELRAAYPFASASTTAAYAITGQNIKLAPPPSDAVNLVISYYRAIPGLQANDTNWLLSAHPDAYLFGVLCEASAFLVDDDRAVKWQNVWDGILSEIQGSGNKYRVSGPMAMRGAVE